MRLQKLKVGLGETLTLAADNLKNRIQYSSRMSSMVALNPETGINSKVICNPFPFQSFLGGIINVSRLCLQIFLHYAMIIRLRSHIPPVALHLLLSGVELPYKHIHDRIAPSFHHKYVLSRNQWHILPREVYQATTHMSGCICL